MFVIYSIKNTDQDVKPSWSKGFLSGLPHGRPGFDSPVVQYKLYNFCIPVNTYHKHNTLDSIFCIIRLNYNVSLMLDILINLKNNILVQKISNFE